MALDFEFYRFNEVNYEGQKKIYSFYAPFFKNCSEMADLACGQGDFPLYMKELGKACLGVDSDPLMCEEARARGVEAECRDVIDFLRFKPECSFDGLFSGHLVEHLPFEIVFELIKESFRVLRPGGVLVFTTPNVRGLYGHFEGFYMHFGHERFYHPRLLEFFLKQAGFHEIESGENELLRGFVLGEESSRLKEIENIKRSQIISNHILTCPPVVPQKTQPLYNVILDEDFKGQKRDFKNALKWKMRLKAASLLWPYFEKIMDYLRDGEKRALRDEEIMEKRYLHLLNVEKQVCEIEKALTGVIGKLDGSAEAFVKGIKR